jgi:fermentation-respiration switch protein FrsA (DUF1100 family)
VGDPPADLPATTITLDSRSGGSIAGWHIRSVDHRGVIVLLHPYRGSRLAMLNRARLLYTEGYSVVMVDFQAHGESPGDRVTIGFLERHDVKAAVDFAKTLHPNEPIGVIGFSMGGAATLLASPLEVDAIVLESVYPDIATAVRNRVQAKLGTFAALPTQLLLMQMKPRMGISVSEMRPIARLAEVGCPIFIMSGTVDAHTTATDTRAMFETAVEPKQLWMVEGANHEDLHEFDTSEYEQRVLQFFQQHLASVTETIQQHC